MVRLVIQRSSRPRKLMARMVPKGVPGNAQSQMAIPKGGAIKTER
jgi:hypothetical protein